MSIIHGYTQLHNPIHTQHSDARNHPFTGRYRMTPISPHGRTRPIRAIGRLMGKNQSFVVMASKTSSNTVLTEKYASALCRRTPSGRGSCHRGIGRNRTLSPKATPDITTGQYSIPPLPCARMAVSIRSSSADWMPINSEVLHLRSLSGRGICRRKTGSTINPAPKDTAVTVIQDHRRKAFSSYP